MSIILLLIGALIGLYLDIGNQSEAKVKYHNTLIVLSIACTTLGIVTYFF